MLDVWRTGCHSRLHVGRFHPVLVWSGELQNQISMDVQHHRHPLVLNSGEPRKRDSLFVWWRANSEESSPPVNQTVNNAADKKAVVNMSPQSITNSDEMIL